MPSVQHSGYWRARGGSSVLLVKGLPGCLGVRIILFCHLTGADRTLLFWPPNISFASSLSPLCFHIRPLSVFDSCLVRLAYRQPLIYNAEVARELLKQIYIAERLQPPTSLASITDAYSILWGRARNPQYWRDLLTTGELTRVAVYAVEAYTIFKVGFSFHFFTIHPFPSGAVC
jgi:hypothetical protein